RRGARPPRAPPSRCAMPVLRGPDSGAPVIVGCKQKPAYRAGYTALNHGENADRGYSKMGDVPLLDQGLQGGSTAPPSPRRSSLKVARPPTVRSPYVDIRTASVVLR